jgi:hypothetical protein
LCSAVPTRRGRKDNRQNVRRRLFLTAIERANKRLEELGIEPIGKVAPHGLRRTFAALRCVAGDDPAYTAAQIGHEDATFTLRVYTHAVKRRERLTGPELQEFNRALEWAQWAQTTQSLFPRLRRPLIQKTKKPAIWSELLSGRCWARTSDPQLVELRRTFASVRGGSLKRRGSAESASGVRFGANVSEQ